MDELHKTKYILLILSAPISMSQLEEFRGAIIRQVGGDSFYHNHVETGYAYRYPLVQYKRIGGHAALLVISEAVDTASRLIGGGNTTLRLGKEEIPFEVARVRPGNALIQVWNDSFSYHLHRWLPLNKENYEEYRQTTALVDRIALLERILTGNILSMSKGLGLTITNQIRCTITQLSNPHKLHYKGVDLVEFNAEFECNVSIPDYFGLGKGVSLGHGVCVRKRQNRQNEQER